MAPPTTEYLKDSFMKRLFEQGLFTDFTIRCQRHKWNVHKAIVCGRSGYFRRLCTSDFKVSRSSERQRDVQFDSELQEAAEATIEICDDNPDIVGRMLIYLYNPTYYASSADWDLYQECTNAGVFGEAKRRQALVIPNDESCTAKHLPDPLVVHAKLHGMSKKYDIPDLQHASCVRFVECVVQAIELDPTFTEYTCYAEDLLDAIDVVYGSKQDSDQILREATVYLARVFMKTIDEHMNNDGMKDLEKEFRDIVRSEKDFAWDMASIDFEKARFTCKYCHQDFIVTKKTSDPPECECAGRGLCGRCVPVSERSCSYCGLPGGCRLIEWENRPRK
ncbi:hypothetical protein EPUS_04538 [Endocarpon pusillum Z07020]|uniref:BTB domain-containing protein n=1 Tax=Endocarpon pusillum (strain Z07020 / HMAS-L-300199) TaxID=1263415 RepID=U1GB07_ENDPU|nr:uncharacterized protein EPUS_04538 [Endocarpon pusillum Z07020]ERF68886.1 hypothetical protein EPUS_04538 [Endocarpon pusillum Z07020]